MTPPVSPPVSPRVTPAAMVEVLLSAMEEEYIGGEKQARILIPVMMLAARGGGYDVAAAVQVHEERGRAWAAEAARRALARMAYEDSDDGESDGDDAADRAHAAGPGGAVGGVPESGAAPEARAGAAGRRGARVRTNQT